MEEDFNIDAAGIVCTILTICGIYLFLNFDDDYVFPTAIYACVSISYILVIVGRLGIKLMDLIERNKYIYIYIIIFLIFLLLF